MSELTLFPNVDHDVANWARLAVYEQEYIEELEDQLAVAKARRAEAIERAIEHGIKEYEGYRFQVRYKDREKFVIDADMLKTAYPGIYKEFYDRAVRDVQVKPNKKELMAELVHLIGDEAAAKAAMQSCGFNVCAEPQFIMTKEGGE